MLEPLPVLPEGKHRQVTIVASADTHKTRAKATKSFAKVLLGHMYALHVKNEADDFYVLFRVEDFDENKHCTISWLLVPSPEQQGRP